MNSLTTFNHDEVLRFGPYEFNGRQRLILRGDQPLAMGGRALDILQLLLQRAGSVVSKQTLIAHVWPSSVVEEANLRVHIAALRRALGDGQNGQRYIVNVPQRGYCFIAPVQRAIAGPQGDSPTPVTDALPIPHNLPARLTSIIGRDGLVGSLVRQVPRRRLLSLTGPGGIGKTTVALRVAELLLEHYQDGVWLIDLSTSQAPQQVVVQLARSLSLGADLSLAALCDALQKHHVLLVLDNCEHLLDTCRETIAALLKACPRLSILATSRAPLRLAEEFVQRLPGLAIPPVSALQRVEDVMSYSAVQLLVGRIRARQQWFTLREQDLPIVRDICRRLDGLPLAIEMAAAQIDAFALVGLQAQLDNCVELLSHGRRTAVARHQSLKAALDWSYERLSALEQTVLQRLAVFKVAFTLDAVIAVISCAALPPSAVRQALERLADQSLLTVEQAHGSQRFRLLKTTRCYAVERLEHSGELRTLEQRHSRYLSRQRHASSPPLTV